MELDLTGRSALVSGSTQGIGYAVAAALLEEGASVVVNGRDAARVDAAVGALAATRPGAQVSGLVADLADPDQVERLLDSVLARGAVDVLVNNVGTFGVGEFAETTDAEWQRYLDVNLMSAVRLSRRLLPPMLERGWGRIVNVASESGVDVPAQMLPYGVSKAALLALGNGLAKLTRGSEVTVNTILGGPTFSDGVAATVTELARAQGTEPHRLRDALVAQRPSSLVQRFLEPSEIADLAAFLSSPRSSAINGAALRADGGVLTTML